jgi:uncharacterized protein (DUF2336 family)
MTAYSSPIADLEEALKGGSAEKRVETLRRVTSLFLSDCDRLNEQQVQVFDDVLVHLIQRVERGALAELSRHLAPVDNAPIEVVRRLAHDDEIKVSGPILSQSPRLTDADLIEIAETKSQEHLLAISGRATVNAGVTDVLVRRGDHRVAHTLAGNLGAHFSEQGFAALTQRACAEASLAERLGARIDLPLQLLQELLARATEVVRRRLLASSTPEVQERIQRALGSVSDRIEREAAGPRDYAEAARRVEEINRNGKLSEETLREFARAGRHEELVVAMSLLCAASVEIVARVMQAIGHDGLIVLAKAGGLKWPTVELILTNRVACHAVPPGDIAQAKTAFLTLSQANAQRTLRFWLTQRAVARKAG